MSLLWPWSIILGMSHAVITQTWKTLVFFLNTDTLWWDSSSSLLTLYFCTNFLSYVYFCCFIVLQVILPWRSQLPVNTVPHVTLRLKGCQSCSVFQVLIGSFSASSNISRKNCIRDSSIEIITRWVLIWPNKSLYPSRPNSKSIQYTKYKKNALSR